jgi:hypothetical protein
MAIREANVSEEERIKRGTWIMMNQTDNNNTEFAYDKIPFDETSY